MYLSLSLVPIFQRLCLSYLRKHNSVVFLHWPGMIYRGVDPYNNTTVTLYIYLRIHILNISHKYEC